MMPVWPPLEEEQHQAEAAEKDIFETDFDMPALDEESGSEAVALEETDTDRESSDFDLTLGEEESGSQVVALEAEEAVEGAAAAVARGARGRRALDEEDLGDLEDAEDLEEEQRDLQGKGDDEEVARRASAEAPRMSHETRDNIIALAVCLLGFIALVILLWLLRR